MAVGFALKFNVIRNTTSGRGSPNGYAGIDSARPTWVHSPRTSTTTSSEASVRGRSPVRTGAGPVRAGLRPRRVQRRGQHLQSHHAQRDHGRERAEPTEYFSLDLFNNIIADTTESAVYLNSEKAGTLVVRSGHNDFYANHHANHTEGHSLGANMSVAPKFVNLSAGNLALQPSSPATRASRARRVAWRARMPRARPALRHQRGHRRVRVRRGDSPGFVLLGNAGDNTLVGGPGNNILCGYGDRIGCSACGAVTSWTAAAVATTCSAAPATTVSSEGWPTTCSARSTARAATTSTAGTAPTPTAPTRRHGGVRRARRHLHGVVDRGRMRESS